MKQLNKTKHSMKLMWGCMAFAVLAIVLVIGGVGAGALWMMMGGAGGNSPGNRGAK
jgi:hypothetical protein